MLRFFWFLVQICIDLYQKTHALVPSSVSPLGRENMPPATHKQVIFFSGFRFVLLGRADMTQLAFSDFPGCILRILSILARSSWDLNKETEILVICDSKKSWNCA